MAACFSLFLRVGLFRRAGLSSQGRDPQFFSEHVGTNVGVGSEKNCGYLDATFPRATTIRPRRIEERRAAFPPQHPAVLRELDVGRSPTLTGLGQERAPCGTNNPLNGEAALSTGSRWDGITHRPARTRWTAERYTGSCVLVERLLVSLYGTGRDVDAVLAEPSFAVASLPGLPRRRGRVRLRSGTPSMSTCPRVGLPSQKMASRRSGDLACGAG
ncbi:hypothetical protein SAMN04487905_1203 [Actinopolyspora xinjiangensis]|uniref:Uncharacterized protein n=1 Tax=Actinopolyspora xinjiangensis TaxID=405564 RepID=A0A1H0X080_9ACTN|nr:hypothetical protein SAMN04487905_1203 [Actinopolyspora xinjiangensis]